MRFFVATKPTPSADFEEIPVESLDEAMDLCREREHAGDYDVRMYYRHGGKPLTRGI